MEITFLFVSEVPCVQPAGLGLDRISRSSQDRRLTLLVRGKYGGAGIVVWAITESSVVTPSWGALASQSLCFKEDVNPCPILVVPFHFRNFCCLGLTDLFCSAFRGRWKILSPLFVLLHSLPEELGIFSFISPWLFSPDVYSEVMFSSLFLCVVDGFVPLFFIIAKTIWNWKWLMVSLFHAWFWQEIVNTRAVLTLLLRSAAKVLE